MNQEPPAPQEPMDPNKFQGSEPQQIQHADYLGAIGQEPDAGRAADVQRRDSDSEVAGIESRLRELKELLEQDPENEDYKREFESLSADYRGTLIDRTELPPQQ